MTVPLLLSAVTLFAAPGRGDYAVVVNDETYADGAWKAVADALVRRHGGALVRYDDAVTDALPALRRHFPRHACFVARPENCGRAYVARVHVMMRQLDEDPYPDAIWGIVTGYEPADALRIAAHDTPLVVKRCLTATVGAPLDAYETGLMFNELKAGVMWEKAAGAVERRACPQDTTRRIVDALNDWKPDVFITSGHATERNWMIGYSYRNGTFTCADGDLCGVDTRGRRHPVRSPNPKVHLPVGNCLIAHIDRRDCMALALMRSAGVLQMVGYTVPTGYGYGGWGVKDYFSELQAGRFTLAEAHYANQLALIYNLERLGKNTPGRARGGLRGDRDTVVLYGDPAWEARMKQRTLPWTQQLVERDGTCTFTVTANERGDWDNRPVVHLLDERITDVTVTAGGAYRPVIGDNFILVKFNEGLRPMKGNRGGPVPVRGDFEKGDTFVVRFTAKTIERGSAR